MTVPARAEVVIVGGGVMGASIAYHLACRGVTDTLLLERSTLASGPTGRSTALIRQHYSQPLLVRMAAHGLRTYSAFRDAVGTDCGFTRTGLLVAAEESERAALERNVAIGRAEGAATELIGPDSVGELDPRISAEGLVFCWEAEAGYCDPYLATAGFAAGARDAGARIEEGVAVTAVEPGSVRTVAGAVAAGAVVVAAGPWSPRLVSPLGYELPAVAVRAEVGRFRLPVEFGTAPPAFADFSPLQFYFRPADPGFLEVGSLDPEHADRPLDDPDACPEGADRETLGGFAKALRLRLRGAAGGHWRASWSAVYDVTPDWHPVIGPVPGVQGVFVAAGFSGHGFKLAPAIGTAIAELVCDGRATSYDLSLLDPERFAAGRLVETTYGYSVLG